MGYPEIPPTAERPTRGTPGEIFLNMPEWYKTRHPEVMRYRWIRTDFENRGLFEGSPNPVKMEIDDGETLATHIKETVLEMGADIVGICEYVPEFHFADSEPPDHNYVISFGVKMEFDDMKRVGPRSQMEVHRVYYKIFDISARVAQYIRSFGYEATGYGNDGPLLMVPYAWLAGLGELGKHGSLITKEFGPSLRLGGISTSLPLMADPGPANFGVDDFCMNCDLCSKHCPGLAIPDEKQEVRGMQLWHVDTEACIPYFKKYDGCKICLMVCPYNFHGEQKQDFHDLAKELARRKLMVGELIEEWALNDTDPVPRAPGQKNPPIYERPRDLPVDLNLPSDRVAAKR
jgi:ferredoxin